MESLTHSESKLDTNTDLPDVSQNIKAGLAYSLDQVGMGRVQMPLSVVGGGRTWQVPSEVDVSVSLDDPKAKGIHMSRLYSLLMDGFKAEALTPLRMFRMLEDLKASQKGLSSSAFLSVEFELPLLRKALLSELAGWRQYPVTWQAELVEDKKKWICGFEVLYSSTCPCSTALAEQILKDSLSKSHDGLEPRLPAIPHSQRSRARIWLEFSTESVIPSMETLIGQAEETLGTPVQTAVKRIDEQEFARLNALNQMFCEDAARKLKAWLEPQNQITDYWVEVCHEESLHAHNAVARCVKGRSGGFKSTQKL